VIPVLPDKFMTEAQSLVGHGAILLSLLDRQALPVAQLFIEARERIEHLSYDAFVYALDALYAIGAVDDAPPVVATRFS
jgi:hypothetical protein